MMQISTTHSSFDQYCSSHKTISHRAAAAPGPEVRRECPMTYFTALPLLATNLATPLTLTPYPKHYSPYTIGFEQG